MNCTRQQAAAIISRNIGLSNDVTFGSSSALSKAATVGQTGVVRELLQQPGANINWQDPDSQSRTALHRACQYGHLDVVKLLVEYGASIEATDEKGMTPLLQAAGLECLDVVRFLEENGSDINAVAADGRTILHFSAADNSVPDLEHFLQSPKLRHSLTTRTKNGRTVLHCAVEAGSVEATRFILLRSSRLEMLSKTDDGYTCLHYAVISGEVRLFPLFKKSGICHYDQTSEGFAAIHFAAKGPFGTLRIPVFVPVSEY
jgi:ankyrin repeat protein